MSAGDTALLDAIERQILDWEDVEVTFKRSVVARAGGWQVTFRSRMLTNKRSIETTGGGATMREAFENAFRDRIAERLA